MRRAVVATGLLVLSAAFVPSPARAVAEPGSGFGPFSLAASAPGVQLRVDDPSLCFKTAAAANGCEGVFPEAVSTLRSGPIGHGLAAVVWPGDIAAGAGSLLVTVGGSAVPPQATLLNDPVRADAYTNVGQPTQSYDTVPGTTMTATALPAHVSAMAAVGEPTRLPVATVGSSVARSAVDVTGTATASAVSHSEVRDLAVAGVLHIASVVSDASATTDGRHAAAKGATTASGITVAGIPVTVDDKGAHALGTGADNDAEQAQVNAALASTGMQVALGAPNGVPQGGAVAYNAQSLVVVFKNPTGFTETLVLGGANVSVAATPAFESVLSPAVAAGPGAAAPSTGTADQPASTSLPPPMTVTTGSGPPVLAGPGPVLASADLPEPGRISTRTTVLVLVGAALLAAGFRRVPEAVLRAAPVECRSEEAP